MDAPKCRLCGKRHWDICAGIDSRDIGMANSIPNKPKSMANREKTMANKPSDMANSPSYKYRDQESRKIYMRDLMRGLREEKKCDCVYDMLLENMGGVPTELSVA